MQSFAPAYHKQKVLCLWRTWEHCRLKWLSIHRDIEQIGGVLSKAGSEWVNEWMYMYIYVEKESKLFKKKPMLWKWSEKKKLYMYGYPLLHKYKNKYAHHHSLHEHVFVWKNKSIDDEIAMQRRGEIGGREGVEIKFIDVTLHIWRQVWEMIDSKTCIGRCINVYLKERKKERKKMRM